VRQYILIHWSSGGVLAYHVDLLPVTEKGKEGEKVGGGMGGSLF
jgi:hypothetical protein